MKLNSPETVFVFSLALAAVALIFGLFELFRLDVADANKWERYKTEQQCSLTGQQRRHIEYHPRYLGMSMETITEYEWKCRGGDIHWVR